MNTTVLIVDRLKIEKYFKNPVREPNCLNEMSYFKFANVLIFLQINIYSIINVVLIIFVEENV